MDPAAWSEAKELIAEALARPPAERDVFLRERCSSPDLLAEVHSLLAHAESLPEFLEVSNPPSLTPGSRFGPYEITSLIGRGGMGEVYRAHDPRLSRDVALKFVPDSLMHDPASLARFRREAQLLAGLNHPNIAQIFGLEEVDGTRCLVLEFVDGETLADRLARDRLGIDEALLIAEQIAAALETAHEAGIIHRDLKPANIVVTRDGHVKVLDFGLAKEVHRHGTSIVGAAVWSSPAADATQPGLILGTTAYMGPEQARGTPIDERADIWAFGCVVYEMLCGRRAFGAGDVTTILAAVINGDPDWSALPAAASPGLKRLLRRCLERNQKERLRHIGEARVAIARLLRHESEDADELPVVRVVPWRRSGAIPAAIGLATGLTTAGVFWFVGPPTVAPARISRLHITPPPGAALSIDGIGRDVAITPDGSRLVYVGADGTALFVRPLDQLEPTPIVSGAAPRAPFVSPDGQWVGFFDGPRTLKKVPITGGPAIQVADLGDSERGATWAGNNTIVFATVGPTSGLQRVSADGGEPSVLTRPDRDRGEAGHSWPESLPGAEAVLYTVTPTNGGLDTASIEALDLRTGRSTVLLRGGSHAQYAASGHLMYSAAGTLRAVRFNSRAMGVIGAPSPVLPQVLTTPWGAVEAAIAGDGTLVYVVEGPGSEGLPQIVVVLHFDVELRRLVPAK